jgi:hypothetical protein
MLLAPKSFEHPDEIYCRAYNKRLSIFQCMSMYVDANALKQKDRPCHTCSQGDEARQEYAKN